MKNKLIKVISLTLFLFVSVTILTAFTFDIKHGSDETVFVNPLVIIIDPGHGGMDAGVAGTKTKWLESDLNLDISKALKAELESRGHKAVLTRPDSNHLSKRRRFHKMDDMRAREKIIKDNKHDAVVSIHCNRFIHDINRRGAQIFLQRGKETEFGEFIQLHLNKMQEKKTSPQLGDFFILRCSPKPSAIVECGFLSNVQDEALLITKEHQQLLAKAISNGIEHFFSEK